MEYKVVIPEEVCAIRGWERDDLPAICVVNQSLASFEPKVVFAWHLSIIVDCDDLAESGMPTPGERSVLDRIGAEFDEALKSGGNALFLARITRAGARQFLYRVHDPEVANRYLTQIIEGGAHAREFDFRMEHDEAWESAEYYLDHWRS